MMGIDGTADKDDHYRLTNQTYSSNYTGKHVDIILFESGSVEAAENGKESHPDFDDPDNTGTSRCIKMNWPDLESTHNNQVTNGNMWNYHGLKSASVAAGLVGGLAKKANIYTVYIGDGDTTTEIIDAIKGWHNAKGNNSSTGIPNPTILCTEWAYASYYHKTAIKCEDIDSITYPGMSTANRPGSGWGSDIRISLHKIIYTFNKLKNIFIALALFRRCAILIIFFYSCFFNQCLNHFLALI